MLLVGRSEQAKARSSQAAKKEKKLRPATENSNALNRRPMPFFAQIIELSPARTDFLALDPRPLAHPTTPHFALALDLIETPQIHPAQGSRASSKSLLTPAPRSTHPAPPRIEGESQRTQRSRSDRATATAMTLNRPRPHTHTHPHRSIDPIDFKRSHTPPTPHPIHSHRIQSNRIDGTSDPNPTRPTDRPTEANQTKTPHTPPTPHTHIYRGKGSSHGGDREPQGGGSGG